MTVTTSGQVRFAALGTTAVVAVTHGDGLAAAERAVRHVLVAVDEAASRFRDDSELSRLHARRGKSTTVSPLLAHALAVALRAAEATDGLVTPTVGGALRTLGYDRDFAEVASGDPAPTGAATPAWPWWQVRCDPATLRVVVPRPVTLDLGATAKALAADLAAAEAAARSGCGVLVSLGGDVAVVGPAPEGGWRIGIGDDHEHADAAAVTIVSGGLATSSITRRRWRRGDRMVHHIADPRTGDAVVPFWRTVSVAAASCVDANTASTAAVVLGAAAPEWLEHRSLPARLVNLRGDVLTVAGWPADLP